MIFLVHRRCFFLWSTLTIAATAFLPQLRAQDARPQVADGIAWYDVQQWGVEGKGWDDTSRYFDRLPSRAEKNIRGAVWSLSRDSAGMLVRFIQSARQRHAASRTALRQAFENLQAEGVKELYYLQSDGLLGDDGEAATDGSHPNDLGMMRYADAYETMLQSILSEE